MFERRSGLNGDSKVYLQMAYDYESYEPYVRNVIDGKEQLVRIAFNIMEGDTRVGEIGFYLYIYFYTAA